MNFTNRLQSYNFSRTYASILEKNFKFSTFFRQFIPFSLVQNKGFLSHYGPKRKIIFGIFLIILVLKKKQPRRICGAVFSSRNSARSVCGLVM